MATRYYPEQLPRQAFDYQMSVPLFTQDEMVNPIKAQDQTSQILAVQRARESAVRFDLTVPEWI